MTASDPAVGKDPLTRDEPPSDEVLDELLRAFSVDVDDNAAAAGVDLTSPEVDALLTPPGTEQPPEDAAEEPTDDDTAAPSAPADEVEPAATDESDEPDEPDESDESAAVDAVVDPSPVVSDASVEHAEPVEPLEPVEQDAGVAGDPLLGTAAGSTVTIVDDNLPDAVYVGGNLDPTAPPRPTVFIDGGQEAIDGSPMISIEDASSAAHIEPRLRDRRIAVKRAAGRRRLKWAIAVGLVVVLMVAALAVLGSGLFAVDSVRVEGARRTDERVLDSIVADLEGRPVLRVDTDAIEARLEALPWVDDARVTTDFPDAATIELRERTAVATVQDRDGGWMLLDADGRVLAMSEEQPEGLTVITVPDLPVVDVAKFAPQGVGAAATLSRSLTPLIESRAEGITVTPDGSDLRLALTGGAEVRFGAAEELVPKLVRLQTVLNDLGDRPVSYIDVSTNDIGVG